jgi:bifunctional non-homologous end joining protein LigD
MGPTLDELIEQGKQIKPEGIFRGCREFREWHERRLILRQSLRRRTTAPLTRFYLCAPPCSLYNHIMKEKLKKYREKRDFTATPEPSGDSDKSKDRPIFVIQKHDATNLHYDLRLEVDGVLKSWAVPKGPSLDPSVKRLAMHVEDHPMNYADFEGVIPKEEYGGGAVIVWDNGVYENLTNKKGVALNMSQGVEHGHVMVRLEGTKLKGGFSLTRMGRDKKEWLLVKNKDDTADPERDILAERPESVISGKTVEQLTATPDEMRSAEAIAALAESLKSEIKPSEMPRNIRPMLAQLSKIPRNQQNYGFEFKWDGIRIIAYWDGAELLLETRNALDTTFRWPELQEMTKAFGRTPIVLDGELVALDAHGKISFSLLATRMHLSRPPSAAQKSKAPITYMIFDLLYVGNTSLMQMPYKERRAALDKLKLIGDSWLAPSWSEAAGDAMFAAALNNDIEGVVGKKLSSAYEPGKRTGSWLKIKAINSQELVIAGWIPEKNDIERGVGALITGYYNDEGKLVFAGKVGTGFTDADRQDLRRKLDPLAANCPFYPKPGLRNAIYVKPVLVGEFEYREWTPDGRLRHPSFKGLRSDKKADEVVLESG